VALAKGGVQEEPRKEDRREEEGEAEEEGEGEGEEEREMRDKQQRPTTSSMTLMGRGEEEKRQPRRPREGMEPKEAGSRDPKGASRDC
jgi:hypothetical protein